MYAIINEWENLKDHALSGAEYETYDDLSDALHMLAVSLKFSIADRRNPKLVHDLWERFDLIEVQDEVDVKDQFDSGEYYDSGVLFHWDTSMCEEVR